MRFRIDANNIASLDDSSAPVRWVDQFLMSALLRITQVFASINLSWNNPNADRRPLLIRIVLYVVDQPCTNGR
ncbi:hypothetical protein V441_10955 [Pseudomonas aeruginosa DHS29]|nr:hypothetical protein DPADHS01_18875 [Pseudomonas aeruginosa DHS01]ESZ83283.1 hypothetical protein V441_10955 [Pseudomonas aeruginosa DHS29]KUI87218.1 hypothetical protein ASV59_22395 [Pseudomonas aeruginosa 0C2E]